MSARVAERLDLENRLRRGLENDAFVLHYQPKVDIDNRQLLGVEALIRWNDPAQGMVGPSHFIPLLEESGLILELGSWVIRRAVADRGEWLARGLAAPRVAVNVSAVQLRKDDFVATIAAALRQDSSPVGIDIEVTESATMEDIDAAIVKLEAVRALGCEISIDDFGTGYSSLAYLAKLPVQSLKIDRAFISGMLDNPDRMTLVSTMISLAQSLRLKVIAEGVETQAQADMLRLLRCDQMQGYLVSRPLPLTAMTAYIGRMAGHLDGSA
jgi:EAL domain-containing protein (putative c-di-GMP-specific phosphodiesterase class I)